MAVEYGNSKIVTSGLVLSLDAGDKNSYPGTGTTWRDTSGGGRNFTFGAGTAAPTFSTDLGGCIVFDGSNDVCDGPASNTFNIAANGDHTVEMVFKPQAANGATFRFNDSSLFNARGIFAHTPYSDTYYYDTGGCCGADARVSYTNNGLLNTVLHFFFRRKSDTTPYRSILRGNAGVITSLVDSGGNSNANYTLDSTTAWIGGNSGFGEWYKGNIYLFRLYNRALTNAEMLQNYNALKSRFGL